jgi:uncharacterized protein YkwD
VRSSIIALIILSGVFSAAVEAQVRSGKPQPILVAEIGAGGRAKSVSQPRIPASDGTVARDSSYGLERQTFDLLNYERASRGMAPLSWDERVAQIARLHSRNMAADGFFSHRGSDGSTVDGRAERLGMGNWLAIAENIAFLKGYDEAAAMAVDRWLKSPNHRKNILSNGWDRSAVGIAVAADGGLYFTQVFMRTD